MMNIRCRLNELLGERAIAPEDLAVTSGLALDRIVAYCDEAVENVSMKEIAAILTALGSNRIGDLFEVVETAEGSDEESLVFEDDWDTPCAVSPNGKHSWYRDVAASSSVYQEYFCSACKHRVFFIL